MTDKQMIIDGVDVSGCSYYQHNMCTATKDDYGDCSLCCQDYDMNDCYYKQLKRKEQECEALQMSENEAGEIIAELTAYKDVNEDFKTAWKELKEENIKFTLDTKKLVAQYSAKLERLEQTLTEIKEIAEKRNYLDYNECLDDILQKISEVENEQTSRYNNN